MDTVHEPECVREWAGSDFEGQPAVPPEEAFRYLSAGNQRWVRGARKLPHQDPWYRSEVGGPVFKQHPFAVVFSCIDSRVPPELVFDQGLNDLFVIRTAGHVLDPLVLGSLQYGPLALGTSLVLVLGHEHCGAVRAAADTLTGGPCPGGSLVHVVRALEPAFETAKDQPGDLVVNMTREHTRLTVETLSADPEFGKRISNGTLDVRGGLYALTPGTVAFDR